MSLKIDATKIKISSNYIMGMQLSNGATRKYKYEATIEENPFFKEEFYSETWTPKRGQFDWGKGETKYFFKDSKKSESFDSIIDLLSSKYELINLEKLKK